MHFDASVATIAALSQMICDAIKWTCTASVVRSDAENIITKLRLSDVPPAPRVPHATPASSDEDECRNTRAARFFIPPNEDVQLALISSAADESKINHEVEAIVKECEQAGSPG